jgi:hypothetical protein
MSPAPAKTIAEIAPSLAELKKLPVHTQGILLLGRLARFFPKGKRFYKGNFSISGPDEYGLAMGYSEREIPEVMRHLLGAPWHDIEQQFYIHSTTGDGWYEITEDGWNEVEKDANVVAPSRTVMEALALLHGDLQGYGHYFQEHKLNEAVSAAFKRVENRLNEVRDSANLSSPSGVSLPYELYKTGTLKFPFPKLAANNQKSREAYEQHLKNFLAAGIGWFRNAFDHEPYNLPEISEGEALEHLFMASYMLRIIDKST